MASINELYALVYERLKSVQTKYDNAENQLRASKDQDAVAKQKRIENLQFQLKKIDEYCCGALPCVQAGICRKSYGQQELADHNASGAEL